MLADLLLADTNIRENLSYAKALSLIPETISRNKSLMTGNLHKMYP
jgi:hypothetical protein